MHLNPRMLRLLAICALVTLLATSLFSNQAVPVVKAATGQAQSGPSAKGPLAPQDVCPTPPSGVGEQLDGRGQRNTRSNAKPPVADAPNLNGWDTIAPLPVARGRAVAQAWSDGNIYIFGGRDFDIDWTSGFGVYLNSVLAYNTNTNSYTQINNVFSNLRYGVNASDMQSAVLTDSTSTRHIYLLGGSGWSERITNTVYTYDPPATSVTALPDTDNWPVNPTRRIAGGSAVVNNKWYVFGGIIKPFSTYSDTWVFDPTAASGSRWTNLNVNMSQPRGYIASVALDGKIYAIGGGRLSPNGTSISNDSIVERFDPANPGAGWVRLADMPTGRSYAHAYAWDTGSGYPLAGKIVVAGGRWDVPDANAYIYDPATNTWTDFPNFNGARRTYASAQYNGKWYAFGGHGTQLESRGAITTLGFVATSETYPGSNPAATPTPSPTAPPEGYWRPGAPQAAARWRAAGVAEAGKLYVLGGLAGSCYDTQQNFNEAYDPTTNTWSVKIPLTDARGSSAAGAWQGNIYLAGGAKPRLGNGDPNNNFPIATHLVYNTATDTWSNGPTMPQVTSGGAGTVLDGKLYAVAGDHNTSPYTSNTNYIYDITAGTWSTGATLPTNTAYAGAGALNGEVYVVGGYNSSYSNVIKSAYAYNPGTNSWRTLPDLQTERQGAAVFAYNGELWVVGGGYQADSTGVGFVVIPSNQSVEIYNPGSNSWRYGPRLNLARHSASAANVNGVLVVSAGYGELTLPLNTERIPGFGGTPSATVTGTPPTATRTRTPAPTNTTGPTSTRTNTPVGTATPNPCLNYVFSTTTGNTLVPGTSLIPGTSGDDLVVNFTLPFAVRLYGSSYTNVNVSTNGNLQFNSANTDFSNDDFPISGFSDAVLPYWDDLNLVGTGDGVYTAVTGAAPNRLLYFEWRGVFFGTTTRVSVNAVFYENTPGRIDFIYGSGADGSSATIGLQEGDGSTRFARFSFNVPSVAPGTRVIANNTCVTTTPVPPTVTTQPSATGTATTAATSTPVPATNTAVAATNTAEPATSTTVPATGTTVAATSTAAATSTPAPTQTPGGATATTQPSSTTVPATSTTTGSTATVAATGTAVAATSTPCTIRFTDVTTSNIFYGDIQFLACRGVINGFPNGDGTFRFEPNSNTRRGEFAKIAVRAFNIPLPTPPPISPFTDVPTTNPFYIYIVALQNAGAINGLNASQCAALGVPSPCFGPNVTIARGQVAVIIQRIRNYPPVTPATPTFSDVPTSYFAYVAIETLAGRGIILGAACPAPQSGQCFRPNDNIRRGELSAVVRRAILDVPATTPTAPAATNTSVAATSTSVPPPATSTAAPSPTAGTQQVNIQGFAFNPQNLTVAVGTTVRWTNLDNAPHNVTSTGGGPLNSGTLTNGQSYSFTFTTPGTYNYECTFHSGMTGTITVQ